MICPSPVILDHSFPTSQEILDEVVGALGNIQAARDEEELILVASPIFSSFVADIDWQKTAEFPQLRDVYRYMTLLFLQPGSTCYVIDTDSLPDAEPHPLPEDCPSTDVTDLWSLELGKIKELHDSRTTTGPFMGIACHRGFSGAVTGRYRDDAGAHLPLVGLDDFNRLENAIVFEIAPNITSQPVTYRNAKRNLSLLGGVVSKPNGSSHYIVHFPNARRPWVLDYNIDPVSEDFLKQIAPLVNQSQEYVRHVLINGSVPRQRNRLHREVHLGVERVHII
jgi:hypothetical protein